MVRIDLPDARQAAPSIGEILLPVERKRDGYKNSRRRFYASPAFLFFAFQAQSAI